MSGRMLVRQNTKTARTWASDYVPDDPDDQENDSPNLDRPSAMEGGSAWAAHLAAEELILRGARTKPVKGQTMVDYVATITHLHLANMGLEGDLASRPALAPGAADPAPVHRARHPELPVLRQGRIPLPAARG